MDKKLIYTVFFAGNDEVPQDFDNYEEAVEYAEERCEMFGGSFSVEEAHGYII